MTELQPIAADRGLPRHLAGLNESQRQAVETIEGPVLVLAGAGTGKTRVLTARLAHILALRKAWPSQLLAVTFTNRAAREMRQRVAREIGGAVEGLWLGTFHSLAARLLRRHAELVGLKPNFTILDTDDQLRLLKQVMEAANLDTKRWPPRPLLNAIERWKDRGLLPAEVPEGEADAAGGGRGRLLYSALQQRLATLNACDFGDLLLHCLTLLRRHADVLRQVSGQFRYLLVDEYQDTNVAQYLLLRLLAQGHRNLCCVGDDDQSIYSWRGAEIGNILRFEQDFPGATVIRLERNYRSTPHILGAASGLIANNRGRLGKTLWTEGPAGEKVAVRGVWDGEEEARLVADEIEADQRAGGRLDRNAILVRASHQTRAFEERFLALAIPYRLIGGPRFYERQEVRDALAYCRLIAQPDDDLAFERAAGVPKRGLGEATFKLLHRLARARNSSLMTATRLALEGEDIPARPRRALGQFVRQLAHWRQALEHLPHVEVVATMLDESGYTAMWQADPAADAAGRLENLKEFVRALSEFDTLIGFLEHVALVTENEAETAEDAVSLMTLHAAKGLEFDTVFLPGWEEGLFPNQRALDEGGNAALEEERRLAYVGLTRARRQVFISYAANRRLYDRWMSGLPSRFIGELPVAHAEADAPNGLNEGFAEQPSAFTHLDRYEGRRMRLARGLAPSPRIDGHVDNVVTDAPGASRFGVGQRIFHDKFGYGRVALVEGNKLEVVFETSGTKKVIDAFLRPA